jgi:hypothetical protein
MIYFLLDDSGTDSRSPVITMAGYAARAHHWAIYDKRAKNLYARYGITELHASDFDSTKGQFKDWTGEKKRAFVSGLYGLVGKCCIIGISISVLKAGYKAAGARTSLNKNISAYGMYFNIIVEHIRTAPELVRSDRPRNLRYALSIKVAALASS